LQSLEKQQKQKHAEFFTPAELCTLMFSLIDEDILHKNILDNSCGEGNILLTAFYKKLLYKQQTQENIKIALNTLYGNDLLEENVEICQNRLFHAALELCSDKTQSENFKFIIKNNITAKNTLKSCSYAIACRNYFYNYLSPYNQNNIDYIIINPPYLKTLHLQFLIHSATEANNVISLQPIRWIQDPLAVYKKGSDFLKLKPILKNRIKQIIPIPLKQATELFNAKFTSDLGIIQIVSEKDPNTIPYEILFKRTIDKEIFNKVWPKIPKKGFIVKEYTNQKYFVPLRELLSVNRKTYYYIAFYLGVLENGLTEDGLTIHEAYMQKKEVTVGREHFKGVEFNSLNEAKNFYNYLFTDFFKFMMYLITLDVHCQFKYLPNMDDYTQPWTNERLNDYFSIDFTTLYDSLDFFT
jgi:hypothetical protein